MNEALDLQRHLDFAPAIQSLASSAFVRLELGKLRLPESEDVRFDSADAGDVADLEVEAIRDGWWVDNAFSGKISGHFSPRERPCSRRCASLCAV
jgi:hypothetical protein